MIISDEIAREGTFSFEDYPFYGEGRQLAASDKLSVLPQVKLVFLLLLNILFLILLRICSRFFLAKELFRFLLGVDSKAAACVDSSMLED